MNHQLSYRYEATTSDVDTVERIVESTGVFNEAEVGVAIELVEERLAHGDASEYFFVFAEEDSTVLGYTCFGPIPATDRRYDIYWIAVDKSLHQRGIGRKLLAETERRIREMQGLRIYVETSSTPHYQPTRDFYVRNGYALAAQLPDYHATGDDLCIYMKSVA